MPTAEPSNPAALLLAAALACCAAKAALADEPSASREGPSAGAASAEHGGRWAGRLKPLKVVSLATKQSVRLCLYASDGGIDQDARELFERIVAGTQPARPLSSRLEQLVVKAAYHFGGADIVVVSGWRPNAGRHGTGEALDFKLVGVSPGLLASYLRRLPRTGVGLYTNRRTRFVHLDVRETSYDWLDASPPGVRWIPARLRNPSAPKRDARWEPDMDLPVDSARDDRRRVASCSRNPG